MSQSPLLPESEVAVPASYESPRIERLSDWQVVVTRPMSVPIQDN